MLKQIGWFLGVGVSISLVAVLFALPGFLYILDGVIGKTTLKSHFLPKDANAPAATATVTAASAAASVATKPEAATDTAVTGTSAQ